MAGRSEDLFGRVAKCIGCNAYRPWWAKDDQACQKCGMWPKTMLPKKPAIDNHES